MGGPPLFVPFIPLLLFPCALQHAWHSFEADLFSKKSAKSSRHGFLKTRGQSLGEAFPHPLLHRHSLNLAWI